MKGKEQAPAVIWMNFSGVYSGEICAETEGSRQVDLSMLEGTNCYCDASAQEKIIKCLASLPLAAVHMIDSGNYHYVTRLWIEQNPEPFHLVVLDNHTDMQLPAFEGLLSCGGWIADALDHCAALSSVTIIGPDEKAFSGADESHRNKVKLISREELKDASSGVGRGPAEKLLKAVRETALPVYLSIDKDVFSEEYAATAWSQGELTWTQAEELLKALFEGLSLCGKRLLGIDICGESDPGDFSGQQKNMLLNQKLIDLFRGRI